MNKKGQIDIKVIMLVFIGLIVGVILFQVIAQSVGTSVNTITVANESLGDAVNETTVYLNADYKAISDVVVYNESGTEIIPSSNYTITNNVVYNGDLRSTFVLSSAVGAGFLDHESTISGDAQPTTYISESGGRAMANLIPIFFALMLVAVALYPVYAGRLMEMFGK